MTPRLKKNIAQYSFHLTQKKGALRPFK